MNKKLFYLLLLFSIIFNLSFMSIFIYRTWIEKPPIPMPPEARGPSFFREKGDEKPQFNNKDWRQFRDMNKLLKPDIDSLINAIRIERFELGELIVADKTDSLLIVSKLDEIIQIQNEIEHILTFHVLQQKEMLPDSLKKVFIKSIVRRYQNMNPRHHGPDADRRYKNQNRPFNRKEKYNENEN